MVKTHENINQYSDSNRSIVTPEFEYHEVLLRECKTLNDMVVLRSAVLLHQKYPLICKLLLVAC